MHLGFLTSEYPHPRSGPAAGIGTSIKNMASALVEKGVQVSVFIYGQTEDAVFTEDGIKFHLLRQRKFKMFGWYLHRKFLQKYLNKFIAVDGIDAIEAPDWTGITAFMKLRCPLVICMNGSDAYFCNLEGCPQKKKNYWFEKTALQSADHLLSVSRFTATETAKLFHLKKKVDVIPNSVDVEVFRPCATEVNPCSILYFGSLIRKKGVLELSAIFNKVAAENPSARLLLAGKDVIDNKTRRSTKELMLEKLTPAAAKSTDWLGVLPYDQVLTHIASAQVVVLPSFAEALPMTWLEAMAMEKPLVTSNIGWAKEVMTDAVTGYTINPKDHTAYARKILQLLDHPEHARELGKAARRKVINKFSTEVVVQRNIEFYEGVIK